MAAVTPDQAGAVFAEQTGEDEKDRKLSGCPAQLADVLMYPAQSLQQPRCCWSLSAESHQGPQPAAEPRQVPKDTFPWAAACKSSAQGWSHPCLSHLLGSGLSSAGGGGGGSNLEDVCREQTPGRLCRAVDGLPHSAHGICPRVSTGTAAHTCGACWAPRTPCATSPGGCLCQVSWQLLDHAGPALPNTYPAAGSIPPPSCALHHPPGPSRHLAPAQRAAAQVQGDLSCYSEVTNPRRENWPSPSSAPVSPLLCCERG